PTPQMNRAPSNPQEIKISSSPSRLPMIQHDSESLFPKASPQSRLTKPSAYQLFEVLGVSPIEPSPPASSPLNPFATTKHGSPEKRLISIPNPTSKNQMDALFVFLRTHSRYWGSQVLHSGTRSFLRKGSVSSIVFSCRILFRGVELCVGRGDTIPIAKEA